MSFTREDVLKAKRRLEQELPGLVAHDYGDYGYRLEATWPGLDYAWIIYRPERPGLQTGIEPTDLDSLIVQIKEAKPDEPTRLSAISLR